MVFYEVVFDFLYYVVVMVVYFYVGYFYVGRIKVIGVVFGNCKGVDVGCGDGDDGEVCNG